jgi:flagellar biosynthetic protein FlhB
VADGGGGGERTEKATPKKREDARKKGQVLKSAEVNTAVSMTAMFAALALFGGGVVRGTMELLTRYLSTHLGDEVDAYTIPSIIGEAVTVMLRTMLPILLVAVGAGVLINLLQVGFLLTGKPLAPKFSKINPLKGFKRIFSLRSLVEMVKAILKIALVGWVIYSEYTARFVEFPNLMLYDTATAGQAIFDMCMAVAFKAAVALVGIGVADYMYQWFDYEKNLKMTKQEVKDEYKMIEGDPQVKGKIKQKQREMSAMRMMQSVPEADVVITNPTHYAVAIKYDDRTAAAPVVLAKGKDLLAQRIKARAREAGVHTVENRPVAQALYLTAKVGQQIPETLYQAVAEILAYVYNVREQKTADRGQTRRAL